MRPGLTRFGGRGGDAFGAEVGTLLIAQEVFSFKKFFGNFIPGSDAK